MTQEGISVVIRVKNEEDYIGRCIQSCVDLLPKPVEFIVVDNGSSDDSLRIAKLFKHDTSLPPNESYCDMRILNILDYSPGSALNLGITNSRHPLILVLSSHCELLSFDQQLMNSVYEYAGIFGLQIPYYYGKRIKQNYIWSHYLNHDIENMHSSLEGRYYFHNALSFFTREFLNSHPFDTQLVGKEDRYWAASVIADGYKTLYTPTLAAKHHYTPDGNTWKGIG